MNYPTNITVKGKSYDVFYENALKRTSSVKIRKGAVVLKLSRFVRGRDRDEMIEKFLKWAGKKLTKVSTDQFVEPDYSDGSAVVTHNRVYEIRYKDSGNSSIKEGVLFVSGVNKKEKIQKLIIKDQTSYLREVIEELNQLHFQEDYNLVRFKRVISRFGSCSSRRNINIAYRLLFAPKFVFQYVCIHELAHLREMNHSYRFWDLVKEAMPEYKDAEKWLRVNGFMLG